MKAIFLFLVLLGSNQLFGQVSVHPSTDPNNITYSCEKMVYTDGQCLELKGGVNITTDQLTVKNAENVVLDRKSNEMVVSGYTEFTMKGKIVFNTNSENTGEKKLYYKLGEEIAYIR